jgi:hypothetical protein
MHNHFRTRSVQSLDTLLPSAAYLVGDLRGRPRNLPLANSGYARETSSAVYPFVGVTLAKWVLMNG